MILTDNFIPIIIKTTNRNRNKTKKIMTMIENYIGDLVLEVVIFTIENNQQFYYPFINLINQYGIPNKYRRILWLELSGANNIRINGEYQELLLNNKTSSGSDGDNKWMH